jgi:predicted SprT family Zn-dependent metalloprotease
MMGVRTMPTDGAFTFRCYHCGFDTGKTPVKHKDSEQDLKLYFCGQCKESTLIRFDGDVSTVFRVES